MRFSICFVLLPCALLAQTSPPRPAGPDTLKNFEQRLDWFQATGQPQQGEWKTLTSAAVRFGAQQTVVALAQPSKACAIPLLRVGPPKNFADKMSVPLQPMGSIDNMPILTPPVCEWKR
jgi:hypothetical protein